MTGKVKVNKETCISAGVCWGACGEVFEQGPENKSNITEPYRGANRFVGEVPEDLLECAKKGENGCPVGAITVEG